MISISLHVILRCVALLIIIAVNSIRQLFLAFSEFPKAPRRLFWRFLRCKNVPDDCFGVSCDVECSPTIKIECVEIIEEISIVSYVAKTVLTILVVPLSTPSPLDDISRCSFFRQFIGHEIHVGFYMIKIMFQPLAQVIMCCSICQFENTIFRTFAITKFEVLALFTSR